MCLVSIIIPCYNQAHFLKECLESIQAQTFKEWNCIVVDDASTDGNPTDIVQEIKDDRISCIRHDRNKGLAASRNTGIKLVKTEFIVPVDADDKLLAEFLDTLLLPLTEKNEIDVSFGDIQAFGESNEIWPPYCVRSNEEMTREQWIPGAGPVMRRKLWEDVGGYCEDEIFRYGNEDWDFWLTAVEHGVRIVHIPKPLYLYRRYPDSMSIKLHLNDYKTREYIYQRHKALYDKTKNTSFFLFNGYLRGGRTNKKVGNRKDAFKLFLKAIRNAYNAKSLFICICEIIFPNFVLNIVRKIRDVISKSNIKT